MKKRGLENSDAKMAMGCCWWGSRARAPFHVFSFPFLSFQDADVAVILCRTLVSKAKENRVGSPPWRSGERKSGSHFQPEGVGVGLGVGVSLF